MVEFISQPWAWYVAGPILAVVMFLLVYFGKNFGLSANLRTMCSIGGAGKVNDFFRFEWKAQRWNLVFVIGAILGGLIVGCGEKLAEVYLGGFVGGAIENWFPYMLALLVLMIRPEGIFGEKIIERV